MEGFLGEFYLWAKALHIIFVIFWMAALFMMPRFFAYHCQYDAGSIEDKNWMEREKRLKKIIMNPAMMIAWTFGILLVLNIGLHAGGWLHFKLLLVVLLTGFHIYLSRQMKMFTNGERPRDERFYRKINEIPAVFIIMIVILAVVRPF